MTIQTYLTTRIIGRAENAHRPILDRLLSATKLTMTAWVALVLTAETTGGLDRDQLTQRLVSRLKSASLPPARR